MFCGFYEEESSASTSSETRSTTTETLESRSTTENTLDRRTPPENTESSSGNVHVSQVEGPQTTSSGDSLASADERVTFTITSLTPSGTDDLTEYCSEDQTLSTCISEAASCDTKTFTETDTYSENYTADDNSELSDIFERDEGQWDDESSGLSEYGLEPDRRKSKLAKKRKNVENDPNICQEKRSKIVKSSKVSESKKPEDKTGRSFEPPTSKNLSSKSQDKTVESGEDSQPSTSKVLVTRSESKTCKFTDVAQTSKNKVFPMKCEDSQSPTKKRFPIKSNESPSRTKKISPIKSKGTAYKSPAKSPSSEITKREKEAFNPAEYNQSSTSDS